MLASSFTSMSHPAPDIVMRIKEKRTGPYDNRFQLEVRSIKRIPETLVELKDVSEIYPYAPHSRFPTPEIGKQYRNELTRRGFFLPLAFDCLEIFIISYAPEKKS